VQKQLQKDFSFFSDQYLKESLDSFNGLYAPTHIFLAEKPERYLQAVRFRLPFDRYKTKGKCRELHDDEFDKERDWILEVMAKTDECEDGIECGCCFARFRFVCMVIYLSTSLTSLVTAQNDPMP
jgi:E3 ubiquitin-protein ligase RNF216